MYLFICTFNNNIMELNEILLLPFKLKSQSYWKFENKGDRKQIYRGFFRGNHIAEGWIKFKCMLLFFKHFGNKILFVCQTKRTQNEEMENTRCEWIIHEPSTQVLSCFVENSDMNYECFSYCDKSQA